MIVLKKPGKKVICIVAAVCVVVIGGIVALVLHMNREVAPWDNLSVSSTSEDVHKYYGVPAYSLTIEEGEGYNFDRYNPYEFLGMSGWANFNYTDNYKISTVEWRYNLPNGNALNDAEQEIEMIENYLTKKFGKSKGVDETGVATWYDFAGKKIIFWKSEVTGKPDDEWYAPAQLAIKYVFWE